MITNLSFDAFLQNVSADFHSIVPYDKQKDKIALLDLGKTNPVFTETTYSNMELFEKFIEDTRKAAGANTCWWL